MKKNLTPEQRIAALIYDIERLALECVACGGIGTIWPNGGHAMSCRPCKPLREIVLNHKKHDAMSLGTAIGSKVIYHNPLNGRGSDMLEARKTLEIGKEYTVRSLNVGDYSSTVEFEENRGKRYNTVLFVNAAEPAPDFIPEFLRRR